MMRRRWSAPALCLLPAGVVAVPVPATAERSDRDRDREGTLAARQVSQGDLTIDGDPTEPAWRHGGRDLPHQLRREFDGKFDNAVRYSTLWDTAYLFVAVQVRDDRLVADSTDPADDDSVQVYVDGDHTGGSVYDPQDNRITMRPGDAGVSALGRNSSDLLYMARTTADGYTLELAIP